MGETGTASLEHSTTITGRPNSTPFAGVFDHQGRLILVEVFPLGQQGDPATGGLTLWENAENGAFNQIGTTNTQGLFSCWVVYDPNNGCAYSSETGSSTVSSYAVGDEIVLVDPQAAEVNGPLELVASLDGEYIYTLSPGVLDGSGQPQIYGYRADSGCELEEVQAISDGFDTEQVRRDAANDVFNGVNGLAIYPHA